MLNRSDQERKREKGKEKERENRERGIYRLRRLAALAQKKRMKAESKRTLESKERKLYPARSKRIHIRKAPRSADAPA